MNRTLGTLAPSPILNPILWLVTRPKHNLTIALNCQVHEGASPPLPYPPPTIALNCQVHEGATPPLHKGHVIRNLSCMLRNNASEMCPQFKYYIKQAIKTEAGCFYYRRWGRCHTAGQSKEEGPMTEEAAIARFVDTFKLKTGNVWGCDLGSIVQLMSLTVDMLHAMEDTAINAWVCYSAFILAPLPRQLWHLL